MEYDFQAIEKRWKAQWKSSDAYRVEEDPNRTKYYVLDMFPYPSGAGGVGRQELDHVGTQQICILNIQVY